MYWCHLRLPWTISCSRSITTALWSAPCGQRHALPSPPRPRLAAGKCALQIPAAKQGHSRGCSPACPAAPGLSSGPAYTPNPTSTTSFAGPPDPAAGEHLVCGSRAAGAGVSVLGNGLTLLTVALPARTQFSVCCLHEFKTQKQDLGHRGRHAMPSGQKSTHVPKSASSSEVAPKNHV